ncbi:MAG: anti-sigma F factor [Lachnospiraceae bacterium]|nr:anti-sigma F factor [Lachnospiraceae bacterium]
MKKRMYLEIDSISENENFARVTVAAFVSRLNPTLEEIADIKTAVSEAVTNAIVHGYDGKEGIVYITCEIEENEVHITIEDKGIGIENVDKAREPLYTTKPDDERSGMGFVFMEVFMDSLTVESKISEGTIIRMSKKIGE